MKRLILLTLFWTTFLSTVAWADYVIIQPVNTFGLTWDKDKGASKRGEVVDILPDTVNFSQKMKDSYLIIKVDDLKQAEKDVLLESWGDPIEDRENYKGKRNLFDFEAVKLEIEAATGQSVTEDVGLYTTPVKASKVTTKTKLKTDSDLKPKPIPEPIPEPTPIPTGSLGFDSAMIMKHLRPKTDREIASYKRHIKTWYFAKRYVQPLLAKMNPLRSASAETITTICPSSCTYASIATWENTEGAAATLSEIKSGNIKDDDGVVNCGAASIDGQTASATAYMRLYSAAGERHAGTETTGASGTGSLLDSDSGSYCLNINDEFTRVEYLQIKGNGTTRNSVFAAGGASGQPIQINNVIIRDASVNRAGIRFYNGYGLISNLLMYDVVGDSCIEAEQASSRVTVQNSTVINCGVQGYERNSVGSWLGVYNSVACGSGTDDFDSNVSVAERVVSCDATACDFNGVSGTSCWESETAANLFEDPTNHDYTPKASSQLLDVGLYLALPNGTTADLAGYTRAASTGDLSDSTRLFLDWEGADAATNTSDKGAYSNRVFALNNGQIDTAKAKFGSSSALFDGAADEFYVNDDNLGHTSANFNLTNSLSETWTVSFFIWFNSFTSSNPRMVNVYLDANHYWQLQHRDTDSSGTAFYTYDSGAEISLTSSGSVLSTGAWHHIALVWDSDEVGIYQNGTRTALLTSNTNTVDLSNGARIDIGSFNAGTSNHVDGWIDDLIISKSNLFGVTPSVDSSLTVPTSSFTISSGWDIGALEKQPAAGATDGVMFFMSKGGYDRTSRSN